MRKANPFPETLAEAFSMTFNEKEKNVLKVGLIFAGMLVFIFVYLHLFFFKAQIDRNERAVSDIMTKTKDMNKELGAIRDFLQKQSETEAMGKRVERMNAKLPSSAKAIEFLDELRASFERTGVRQNKITPKPYKSRTLFTEIPYEVAGNARYHEFGQFLNIIECNPRRFMRVNSLEIRDNPGRPSIHPVTVGISTFMFNKGG